MHKVKKPTQHYFAKMQEAVTMWKAWAEKYPDDVMKQFLAKQVMLAANRTISPKELHRSVTGYSGLMETSKLWHDVPRFD